MILIWHLINKIFYFFIFIIMITIKKTSYLLKSVRHWLRNILTLIIAYLDKNIPIV